MAIEVFIPKMSDHMETGRILKWLFHEGDSVQKDDLLVEIETDKAVGEIQAAASGILSGIRAEAGDEVPVGQPIAWILAPGEALSEVKTVEANHPVSSQNQTETRDRVRRELEPQVKDADAVRATPAARRLARELKLDLSTIGGSGPAGTIRDEDVLRAAERAVNQPSEEVGGSLERFTPAWRLTGQRMLESVQTIPHFYLQLKVDASSLLHQLEKARPGIFAETGERLSLTALLVEATARALQAHQRLNSRVEQEGLRLLPEINLAVAVDAPSGLVAPVINRADRLPLSEITSKLRALQRKALDGRLAPQDLADGTFTISNLGMLGVNMFQAIINPPQVAILAVGQVVDEPVELPNSAVGWVPHFTLSLSADHRAVDGAGAARFLADLKQLLETPRGLLDGDEGLLK